MKNRYLRCDRCGKHFRIGNTNGMPNGVGIVGDDKSICNVCQDCLIQIGKEREAGKEMKI